LQGFCAAHGLHGLFAAQGLQGLAPHGLQGFAAQGLQGFFAAQGLAVAASTRRGTVHFVLDVCGAAPHGPQGPHGLAAQGLQGLHGFFAAQGLHGFCAAQGFAADAGGAATNTPPAAPPATRPTVMSTGTTVSESLGTLRACRRRLDISTFLVDCRASLGRMPPGPIAEETVGPKGGDTRFTLVHDCVTAGIAISS
jgi:hypothetical protein